MKNKLVLLFFIPIYLLQAQQWVIETNPNFNSTFAKLNDPVIIYFSKEIDPATLNEQTIIIHGLKRGYYKSKSITYNKELKSVTFTPTKPFFASEIVQVTITTGVKDTATNPMPLPFSWMFAVKPPIKTAGVYKETMLQTHLYGFTPGLIRLADITNDGNLDVITATACYFGAIGILYSEGGGKLSTVNWVNQFFNSVNYLVVADFDADGDMDIVNENDSLRLQINDGTGKFPTNRYIGGSPNGYQFEVADLNGDGLQDILRCDGFDSSFTVLLNTGGGYFKKHFTMPMHKYCGYATLCDLDNNGTIDIAFSGYTGQDHGSARSSVYFFSNDGNGIFTKQYEIEYVGFVSHCSSGDFDSDGDMDVVAEIAHNVGGQLIENKGNWIFENKKIIPQENQMRYTQFSDLNGDGFSDIIADDNMYNPGSFSIHLNDGFGNFTRTKIETYNSTSALDVGDIDGDGSVDIAVSGAGVGGPYFSIFMEKNSPALFVSKNGEQIPDRLTLHQNFPNPFNGGTTIRYELPERSTVTLTVYDVLGRTIAQLVKEDQTEGSYDVRWNAEVASGLYFCKLETQKNNSASNKISVLTKKMQLIR